MKSSILLFAFLFVFLSSAAFPQLAGDYYIPQGTNPQGFSTLAAACTAITTSGVSAPVRFIIDADLSETAANLIITTATTTATNTLKILPNTGSSHTITMSGCAASGNNGYAGFTIYGTNYVTIDGSNGTGSSLTFTMNDAINGSYVLLLNGGGNNNTVQNCSFNFASMPASGTYVIYVGGNATPVPYNVTVQNNNIAQTGLLPQYGIYFQGAYSPISGYGGKVKSNKINCYQAGVTINDVGTADGPYEVSGNTLNIGSVTAASYVEAIYLAYFGGTINVNNNKILSLTTNAAAGAGLLGISLYGTVSTTAVPVINIYNNFISGFTINSTAYTGPVDGIWFENGGDQTYTANVYYNTIYINSMGGKATGTQVAAVARTANLSHVSLTMKDNILYNDNNTATSFAIYSPGTAGVTGPLVSDYNDLYVSGTGNAGYYNATTCLDLAAWRTASSNDPNSVSEQTSFVSNVSPFDLHLTGSSNGDVKLAGVPISGITTDIDGQTRSATFPYMGADEASNPLPVELTSFTASLNGNSVILNWHTATETNNSGFEIQRSVGSATWEKIGFINGAGSSTSAKNYSFTDNSLSKAGVYSYRLNQVDYNGTSKLSNTVEVNYTTPANYALSQNYPNPFNPSTIINYNLPQASNVKLIVYNTIGQNVKVLENGYKEAGNYSVSFNASELPSGLYFYKIEAGQYSQTRKMMLLK